MPLWSPSRFQVEDVAKACCDFLTKHVEPANVIGIARFAEEIGCCELHCWCRDYINTHFSEVRSSKSQTARRQSSSSVPATELLCNLGNQRRGVLQPVSLPAAGAHQSGQSEGSLRV